MSFDIISLKGLILCLGFLLSGIVDAVCGGGGLITLPLFMATGFPPHFITGTNQSSIVAGGTASLFRFAKSGHIHWRSALMTVPFAIIGAVIGAKLNMMIPDSWLEIIMLILVPLVTVLVLLKRDFGAENGMENLNPLRRNIAPILIGFVIGAYQGFYGAASGMFFMLGFAVLLRLDLTTASGNTKLVSFSAVSASVVTYALSGTVYWKVSLVCTVFYLAGSYFGAGLAIRRGARFIRPVFLAVLGILFIRLILTRFFGI